MIIMALPQPSMGRLGNGIFCARTEGKPRKDEQQPRANSNSGVETVDKGCLRRVFAVPLRVYCGLQWDFHFIPRVDKDIQGNRDGTDLPKFMQTLNDHMYKELEKTARKRGVSIQELIRAVVLPEWLARQGEREKQRES